MPSNTTTTIDRHDKFMTINYQRYPISMDHGKGALLWDEEGRQYLDLFAGFGASILGHCHDDLVQAVTEQANKLWHVGNLFHTTPQTKLAQAISENGFGGRSFFCHSGADSNEAAIKLARLYGHRNPDKNGQPRTIILTAKQSFHGRSYSTMGATGQDAVRSGFEPVDPGFKNVEYNNLEAIKQTIDDQTVAIMLEPIQGEGGVIIPDKSYFPALRKLCDEKDLILIVDEVWTGCGRTGKAFAYQHFDFEPDIMTLAKGVGGGLPVGVMCAGERVAELYDVTNSNSGRHASTLGGNCISMAAAARIFEVLQRDNLIDRAADLGAKALQRLNEFAKNAPIKQVRGKGLFLGIDLDVDSKDAWFDSAKQVVDKCLEQKLLINATQNNILRLAPALIIEPAQLDEGLDILEAVIRG